MHAVRCIPALPDPIMSRFPRVAPFLLSPLVVAAAVALSACSSSKPKFGDDQLLSSAPNQFSRSFMFASADACEASRRALLSQGYMTTMTRNDTVDATKNFQPTSDEHIAVEVHVVCTDGDASNTSMVYVNAVQNGYALKKSDTSASVGLSILGSVSLPIRSNSDAMVKISSETIQSNAFYGRFFDLVGKYLGTSARSEAVPDTGEIKITPLPPVVTPVAKTTPPPVPPAVAAPAQGVQPVAASAGAAVTAAPAALAASGAASAAHVASTAALTAAAAPAASAASATLAPAAFGSSAATLASASTAPAPATHGASGGTATESNAGAASAPASAAPTSTTAATP